MTAPHSEESFGHNEDEDGYDVAEPINGSSPSDDEDEDGYDVAEPINGSSPSDDEETEEHLTDPIDSKANERVF